MADDSSQEKKKAPWPKMRLKHKILFITFNLLMMGLLRTGYVFFIIGMLPGVVAYYMDVTKHRYTFKSVAAANMSGMMPYITRIIGHGPSSSELNDIMGNSLTWCTIYGAAFLGWLLIKLCPMAAEAMVKGMHQTQIMRYQWMQKKLEGEWGAEVKQFTTDSQQN